MRERYVAAIDQGTTSSRCVLFDLDGTPVAIGRREHEQITPQAGWVEHDPRELWENTRAAVDACLAEAGATAQEVAAIGITNQRETTVVWDRATGEPIHNAIVWQDTRTAGLVSELAGEQGVDRLRARSGLPLSTYFAGPKVTWILENVRGARERAEAGELAFGTIDTWVAFNLMGGQHITDVTNASRTMLMDLQTLEWIPEHCELMGIPAALLPAIRSSSEIYGEASETALAGRPVAGILGDQQAALFGQAAFARGDAKNTYGTGSFLLINTGAEPAASEHLLSTVAHRLGDEPPRYALEGSIAYTGALIQWLRDRLGIIDSSADVEALAAEVPDTGGVYLVPAFSGLFAPYWRPDARGVITGLTAFAGRAHIARAALEAAAWQTKDVLEAVPAGKALSELRVDGGMTTNELLMQFQADVLGVPVVRPRVTETTALGAAYAAGLAVGFWADTDDVRSRWREDRRWVPTLAGAEVDRRFAQWRKAVRRTLDWVE